MKLRNLTILTLSLLLCVSCSESPIEEQKPIDLNQALIKHLNDNGVILEKETSESLLFLRGDVTPSEFKNLLIIFSEQNNLFFEEQSDPRARDIECFYTVYSGGETHGFIWCIDHDDPTYYEISSILHH